MNLRYQIFMRINGNLRLDCETDDRSSANERYEQLHRLFPCSEIKLHDRMLVGTDVAALDGFVATAAARAD